MTTEPLHQLLDLSHDVGLELRDQAILGEGNTSCRVDDETFLVKASGTSLSTLAEGDVTRCRFEPLLALLERPDVSDAEITETLLASRVDDSAKKPSV
ncbi:MAG: class II aldolase, partial [Planctomycetota bacterium]